MPLRNLLFRIQSQFDRSGTDDATRGLQDVEDAAKDVEQASGDAAEAGEGIGAGIERGVGVAVGAIGTAIAALAGLRDELDALNQRDIGTGALADQLGISLPEAQAVTALVETVGGDASDIFGLTEGIGARIAAFREAGSDENDLTGRAFRAVGFDPETYDLLDPAARIDYIQQVSRANLGNPNAQVAFGELFGGEDARVVQNLGRLSEQGLNFGNIASRIETSRGLELERDDVGDAIRSEFVAALDRQIDDVQLREGGFFTQLANSLVPDNVEDALGGRAQAGRFAAGLAGADNPFGITPDQTVSLTAALDANTAALTENSIITRAAGGDIAGAAALNRLAAAQVREGQRDQPAGLINQIGEAQIYDFGSQRTENEAAAGNLDAYFGAL